MDDSETKRRSHAVGAPEEIQAQMEAIKSRRRRTIHDAVMERDLDLVRAFLDGGVDVNTLDPHGDTPLVRAAQYGRTDVVRLLVERGADLSSENEQATRALTGAVVCGHLESVRALLGAGVDVNGHLGHETVNSAKPQPDGSVAITYRKENGETALHKAVAFRRTEIVRLLLERGADVSAIDDDGRTPARFTGQGRQWAEIVEMLKDAKA